MNHFPGRGEEIVCMMGVPVGSPVFIGGDVVVVTFSPIRHI
jgi:hypothetical protein